MKSPAEIALLRKAAEISSEGHRAVLMMPEPQHEYEIQAVLESTFLRLGGERPAYGSIVGSGSNGTLLHYMLDRGPARPGDLVVIDAATQYDGYAADVTRTIPVSGKYTAAQRQLYQLVRDAQAATERNAKRRNVARRIGRFVGADSRRGAREARPDRERRRDVRSTRSGARGGRGAAVSPRRRRRRRVSG